MIVVTTVVTPPVPNSELEAIHTRNCFLCVGLVTGYSSLVPMLQLINMASAVYLCFSDANVFVLFVLLRRL